MTEPFDWELELAGVQLIDNTPMEAEIARREIADIIRRVEAEAAALATIAELRRRGIYVCLDNEDSRGWQINAYDGQHRHWDGHGHVYPYQLAFEMGATLAEAVGKIVHKLGKGDK